MRTGMIALALGLLALRLLPALPPTWFLLTLPVLALMLLPFRTYPLALFLLGFSWACLSAQRALDDRLPPRLDGETFWVTGQVVGLPSRLDGVVRFELEDATSRRAKLPALIRVSWYGGPEVRSGERWRLAVKLKRPAGLLNPDAFDYQAWLLAQRIGATAGVVDGQRLASASMAWRDGIRQRLLAVDAQGREGGLAALVLGDGSGLSRGDWQVLQDTGTVHLLVISGQHIGLLAGVVYLLIAGLARWGWWPPAVPWLPWACGLALIAALGYGLLAGFDVPVRRACVMVAMILLWRWRFRHLGILLPFLVSLTVVLVFEPLVSLQPGFWLSFGAVAILMLIFGGRLGAWRWWQSWNRAQWLIAVGLLPILLALNLPISISGPFANLLAVPWVSLIVLPLALLGTLFLAVPFLGAGLLWLAGGALEGLFLCLAWVAGVVPAWLPSAMPGWAWGLSLLGAVVLLLPAGLPLRPLGWPLLLLCVFPPLKQVPYGQVEVLQLDVGQGLAILLRTRHHTLLFDAGPRFGEFDIGERIVVPAMRKAGVRSLDLMLISHADADHAGGAAAVHRAFPVNRVLSGEPQKLPGQLDARICNNHEAWQWDGVSFSTWRWEQAPEGNPSSCMLSVEANGERLLLTGDVDAQAEQAAIDSGFDLRAHWLQAPHHGSRSSSSKPFLRAVAPTGVLISRGHNNAFGHPHPLVMSRYRWFGIPSHDSAELGAIHLSLGTFGQPRAQQLERRFWRD
jgi:competence protein ComEC